MLSLTLYLQLQLWRIKEALKGVPTHASGPKKPDLASQEDLNGR